LSLEGSTFADEAAVRSALLEADSRSAILRSLAERSRRESILADRMPELEALGLPTESPDSEALVSAAEAARKSARAAADLVSGISDRLDSADAFLRAAAKLESEGGPEHHELLELEEMVGVLEGRRTTSKVSLEDWVLSCYLRDVVAAANAHLAGMTGGRYELAVDSSHVPGGARAGLDLVVIDADTGRSRPTRSLSGGETFKASLALALGMADVLTAGAGGIRVDSLFVDEGFGSLDSDSVDTVIEVLDALRGRGTMVGLISHVEAMQEALPVAVKVKVRDDRRGSVVEQPDVEQAVLAALSLV
jgi:exonuclease SbcC